MKKKFNAQIIDIPVDCITFCSGMSIRDSRLWSNQIRRNLYILFIVLFLLFGIVKVNGVGIAYNEFACQDGRPVTMYPGEERDVTLWLQNSKAEDESVRVKIVNNEEGIATLREGNYLVKAKTYDQTIKVNLKMPQDVTIEQKYNVLINFYNIPNENLGGISMTTEMNVNICLQVGEEPVVSLSPEEPVNMTPWIVLGIIALAIIIAGIIYLVKRKKK